MDVVVVVEEVVVAVVVVVVVVGTTIAVGQANFWMRSLPLSATKTFPLPSTATKTGVLNCPSPLPLLPHLVRKVPVFVNFWIRSLR